MLKTRPVIKSLSSDKDSFKYSVLISLHYYKIANHQRRTTKQYILNKVS